MKHFIAIAALLALPLTAAAQEAPPPKPCAGKQGIGLVKSACKKGGQKKAKKAMGGWVRGIKKAKKAAGVVGFKLTCKTCHTSMSGSFPTKGDAKSRYNKLNAWKRAQKKKKKEEGSVTPREVDQITAHLQQLFKL
jgi:cytochrome c5